MYSLERAAIALRRSRLLRRADPLWLVIRPTYVRSLRWLARRGLARNINGTDLIRITPDLYGLSETYEPEVWRSIMSEIGPGDVVGDVGAAIGLYTVAFALRAGPQGRVHAFEPNPLTLGWLRRNVRLNGVDDRVVVHPYAVGDCAGMVSFVAGRESESHVATEPTSETIEVQVVTLDSVFVDVPVNLLKIDVEGFEERVLRGGAGLLRHPQRAPRAIFVEVHPYAWAQFGVTGESLLAFLRSCDYEVFDLNGKVVIGVAKYGEIVARKRTASQTR